MTSRAGLLCLPTLSTHGYEVMARSAIDAMAAIVVDFLVQPDGDATGRHKAGWPEKRFHTTD